MKKTIGLIAISALIMASCKKQGCMDPAAANYDPQAKKEGVCEYIPVITLNGDNPDTVGIGEDYKDPGATATNIGGESIAVSIDSTEEQTDSLGTFKIYYTATNEIGTATEERTVHVVHGQGSYVGNWLASSDCDAVQFPLATDPVIYAASSPDSIIIDNMFTLVGGTISAYVDQTTIVVPQQSVDIQLGEIILSGSGTLNNLGTQMVIDYTYENTTPFVGGTGSCTGVYDK